MLDKLLFFGVLCVIALLFFINAWEKVNIEKYKLQQIKELMQENENVVDSMTDAMIKMDKQYIEFLTENNRRLVAQFEDILFRISGVDN